MRTTTTKSSGVFRLLFSPRERKHKLFGTWLTPGCETHPFGNFHIQHSAGLIKSSSKLCVCTASINRLSINSKPSSDGKHQKHILLNILITHIVLTLLRSNQRLLSREYYACSFPFCCLFFVFLSHANASITMPQRPAMVFFPHFTLLQVSKLA